MNRIQILVTGFLLSTSFLNVQSQTARVGYDSIDTRLESERKTALMEKVKQGKSAEVIAGIKGESPYAEDDAWQIHFIGRNVERLSAHAKEAGSKAEAYALAQAGAQEMASWMEANESKISRDQRVSAHILMGRLHERSLKDSREATKCFEKAVKELAPQGWEYKGLAEVTTLRDRLNEQGEGLSKEEAFVFKRYIFLKRQEQIIHDRIIAAANVRAQRAISQKSE